MTTRKQLAALAKGRAKRKKNLRKKKTARKRKRRRMEDVNFAPI